MNYLLSDDQRDLLSGLGVILAREAGPSRAMELGSGQHDDRLWSVLVERGFLEVASGPDTGPLEAALVVEAVARAGGLVAAGSAALVAPHLITSGPSINSGLSAPVALADCAGSSLVRFASVAGTLLGIDGDEAVLVDVDAGEIAPVRSTFGVPVGRLPAGIWSRGKRLGAGSGPDLRRWWQVAIAVEAAGLLAAALATTVDYVNRREQFGHPIAGFQAVRHRLAECAVLVEGTRWLALEAAAHGAPIEGAATACAYATAAARQVAAETHQLTGAMGFTTEYALHVFTTRAHGLTLELGGVAAHSQAVSQARWGDLLS